MFSHFILGRLILTVVFGSLVLLFTPTPTAGAFAAKAEIRIELNGQPMATEVPPFIRNGTTFVPFRTLFESLGLQVSWDPVSKRITGNGDGIKIELQVDRFQAIVNSTERLLAEAPSIVNGRAFVPLRFVSESVSATVQWLPEQRLILIVSEGDYFQKSARDFDKKAIFDAYSEYVRLANLEDLKGIDAMFHELSPIRNAIQQALKDAYTRRDIATLVMSMVIEELRKNDAILRVTEKHTKQSGAFFMDQIATVEVAFRKNTLGQWRLYDAQTLELEWLVPEGWKPQELVTDASVKASVRQSLTSYVDALNKEDMNTVLSLLDVNAMDQVSMEPALRLMFDAYDFKHELESLVVMERAQDEVYVYTVQTARKLKGPRFADVRSVSIHTFRLQGDGSWKLYATSNGPTQMLSLAQ
jgi:ketosteroid isomerase-like protein